MSWFSSIIYDRSIMCDMIPFWQMAMEMGQASVAVVASSFIPSVLKWTCSLLGSGVRLIKRIPKAIQGSIQLIKGIPRFFKASLSSAKGIPQSMKGIPKSVKKSAWIIKDRMRFGRRSLGASKKDPPIYKYFFFRNAYNQRKVAMFVREGEKYKEIFVQNPRTKKMECILSYPKEAWSSVWNRFYCQRSWGFEDQRNLEWSWNSYLLEDFYQNPCVDLI